MLSYCPSHLPNVAEFSSPATILGKTSWAVATFLCQPGALGSANIISLTSSEMNSLVERRVPSEVQDIFRTTFDILLAEDHLASPDAELPPDLVAIFYKTYSNAQPLQAPGWLLDRLRQISGLLPMVHEEAELPRLAVPEPG